MTELPGLTERDFLSSFQNNYAIIGKTVLEDVNFLNLVQHKTNIHLANNRIKIINECVFKGTFFIDRSFDKDLEFNNCIFEGEFRVYQTNHSKNYSFTNCEFKYNILLTQVGLRSLKFNKSIVRGSEFIIDKCTIDNLLIEGEKLENTKNLEVPINIKTLIFKDSCTVVEFNLKTIRAETIEFNGGYGIINIVGIKANKLTFTKLVFINGVSGGPSININGTSEKDWHSSLESLQFHPKFNLTENVKFEIDGITINHLQLNYLKNYSTVNLRNLHFTGLVELNHNSGNFKLNNVDFYKSRLDLINSDLSKMTFSSIIWPKDHLLNNDNVKDYDDILKVKDSYRQLKWVNKSQGNNIDALGFNKNELRQYFKLVWKHGWDGRKNGKIHLGTILKTARVKSQEILIIGSNWLFSKFGQSLLRPLYWLFSVHLGLFIWLVCQVPELKVPLHFEWFSYPDWNFWGKYFYYLSPIRKVPSDFEGNGVYLGIDFIIRLFSGYFIFHIIKASRKYTGD